jgi:single-strand DNA-binding protein
MLGDAGTKARSDRGGPVAVSTATTAAPSGHVNEVHLVGRLAGEPRRRELPSGDVLVSFRVVVSRAPARRGGPTVDTLDCAAWRADVQRSVERAAEGDLVELHGSLRRRFWRVGAGAASRSEVEVVRMKRLPPTG